MVEFPGTILVKLSVLYCLIDTTSNVLLSSTYKFSLCLFQAPVLDQNPNQQTE